MNLSSSRDGRAWGMAQIVLLTAALGAFLIGLLEFGHRGWERAAMPIGTACFAGAWIIRWGVLRHRAEGGR